MRLRSDGSPSINFSDEAIIRKVLAVDGFQIHDLKVINDTVRIAVKNTKFRSTAQALGRVASTLQRFAADDVRFAKISFYSKDLLAATYRVDLQKIAVEQFHPSISSVNYPAIRAIDLDVPRSQTSHQRFKWGIGPYIAHRLFNPDLPLSMETGIEIEADYQITNGLKTSELFENQYSLILLTINDVQILYYRACTRIGPFTIWLAKVATSTN